VAPGWVDYLGAFSTAGATILALAALTFAVKAGRDLIHDRRDTFELQILRELYDAVDAGSATRAVVLMKFMHQPFPATAEFADIYPKLWQEATSGVITNPAHDFDTDYIAWRGRELLRVAISAKAEILRAVNERTGRS
jgi:hypothetical protein